MSPPAILSAREGDTLDLLCWRDRGLGPADLPAVLTLNPGLAARGPVLPAGLAVSVPARSVTPPVLAVIQLWD